MTIFRHKGRWVASEKLDAERGELLVAIAEHLSPFLEEHDCRAVDLTTWSHEASDTLIHVCCLPRTNG